MIGYLAGIATGIALVLGVLVVVHLDGIRRNRAEHPEGGDPTPPASASLLRRAWHVLAAKPTSPAARLLRILIATGTPLTIACVLWIRPLPIHPTSLIWAYALLWIVRQRDAARCAAGVAR